MLQRISAAGWMVLGRDYFAGAIRKNKDLITIGTINSTVSSKLQIYNQFQHFGVVPDYVSQGLCAHAPVVV